MLCKQACMIKTNNGLRLYLTIHGQLYVALSRATNVNQMAVLLSSSGDSSTVNIVYPEVLLQVSSFNFILFTYYI